MYWFVWLLADIVFLCWQEKIRGSTSHASLAWLFPLLNAKIKSIKYKNNRTREQTKIPIRTFSVLTSLVDHHNKNQKIRYVSIFYIQIWVFSVLVTGILRLLLLSLHVWFKLSCYSCVLRYKTIWLYPLICILILWVHCDENRYDSKYFFQSKSSTPLHLAS